jgi:SAM-dependent methyltransferase
MRILDWGCGCGRIIRWWSDVPDIRVDGCDYNSELVAWVDQNLPFVNASVNQLAPPLPYEPESFDFVYALSVFTHLTDDMAHSWMREIHRVLAPGGLFFFSTHGMSYRDKLAPAETARFDSGIPVVQFSSVEGSNLCAAYHPRQWIESSLLDGFQLIELREPHLLDESERAGLVQDRWLIRKRLSQK